MLDPNISIITNFGCRAECWYCIWKGHKLENVSMPTDWNKLYNFLSEHRDKGKFSVSGGGDCLYRYEEYSSWWENIFDIAEELHMLVDVHTREKFKSKSFWQDHINRCVFSSDNLNDDIDYLNYLTELTKVRITHLITANTTFHMIDEYLKFQNKINCQFTIKQLVNYDDNGMFVKIREKYPDIYYLEEGDYNIYYMPDNSITDKFLL